MKYLFLDESGDHNLLANKIDPSFPIFVLTGISISKLSYQKLRRDWFKLKTKMFGSREVFFHTLEMVRPQKAKDERLYLLSNASFRHQFYKEINSIMKKHDFSIIAFTINKYGFSKLFPAHPPDPYFLSFSYIFGEFVSHLSKRESGTIVAEKRNPQLDKQFLLSWKLASQSKIGLVTNGDLVKHKIKMPQLLPKSWNYTGIELADMISYRLSRSIMNKPIKLAGNEIDIDIINKKLKLGTLPAL